MAIEPVSSLANIAPVTTTKRASTVEKTIEENNNDAAAVYEKSEPETTTVIYKRDTVTKMSAELDGKYSNLKNVVKKLLSAQVAKAKLGEGVSVDDINKLYTGNLKEFYSSLVVDDETRLQAQQDIAEDGYWGVKQTSERLVDFAKNLSGGDKAKIEELRAAIMKGFENAEKAWGGALPAICMQTKDAVMKGLDDWANE